MVTFEPAANPLWRPVDSLNFRILDFGLCLLMQLGANHEESALALINITNLTQSVFVNRRLCQSFLVTTSTLDAAILTPVVTQGCT